MTTLSRQQARAFYDRFGAKQDAQAYYEDPANRELITRAAFPDARAVVELGCGTGRLAETLLAAHLPGAATYLGLDISPTMIRLAGRRLARFEPRAAVRLIDGSLPLDLPGGVCDRFVSTYVLDLLPEEEIRTVVREAARVLEPAGLLCLTSLGRGSSRLARLVAAGIATIHAWRPSLVGGCRPLHLLDYLPPDQWEVRYAGAVAPYAIPSDIVVASARIPAAPTPARGANADGGRASRPEPCSPFPCP